MKTKFISLSIVFITAINVFGQIDSKITTIDKMINIYANYYGFCGTVLIEKNGELVLNKGYGYASYELDMPCTDSTKYHISSITKGLTRVLIDKLVNEEKLNLNDKLYKYLPEIGENLGNKIQIKHLLIHQSGLKEKFFDDLNRKTKIENIESLKDTEFAFEPGTKEQYCNLNYYILGILIERISGFDLNSAYNELIFKPLEMNNSSLDNGEKMLKNMAIPHYVNQVNQSDRFIHVYPKPNGKGSAAGGIIMTTKDLLKWVKAYHTNQFNLKVDSFNNPISKYYNKGYDDYRLGWATNEVKRKYAEGDGIGEGFRSLYLFFPEEKLTILYLNNSYYFPSNYNSNMNIIVFDNVVYETANIMLDREYLLPKLPIGEVLIKNMEKGANVNEIISTYKKLKGNVNEYLFNVKQLNRLAYYYMDNNMLSDAYKILELNFSEYPEHWIKEMNASEPLMRCREVVHPVKSYEVCGGVKSSVERY